MKYLGNQTNFIATPYKPCDGGLEYLVMMGVVQFVSFSINLVATIAVWKVPGKENNKFHLAVRTLVLSDLSISASTLPFSVVSFVNCSWIRGEILCYITAFISNTFLSWSFLVVFIICLLRFLAVTRPLYYRNQVTCARVKKALLCALIWPCAHLILPLAGFGKFQLYKRGYYCSLDLTPTEPKQKVLVYATVAEGSLITLAMLYFCGKILSSFHRKRRVSSFLSKQQQRAAAIHRIKKQQDGFARLTFVIVLVFYGCYVPFLSLRAFILIRGPSAFNETSYFYSELLAHLNSLLNPLVYVICHKHYRSSIKDLFKSCHCSGGFRIIKRGKFFLKDEDERSKVELRKMSALSIATQRVILN
ncbi:histamine H2 receptor-like [Acropora muricata]|uniref:histamine H2 receptor-like n=1 Tax=Acropora muricata TaxID=159855 RepID=UPI0034E4B69E